MDTQNAKLVIEFPKEEFDNLMRELREIRQVVSPPASEVSTDDLPMDRIPVHEFAYIIGVGKTTLARFINGTHPSGFRLKTFRKPGTRRVWTLKSEIDRYFENFGS